MHLFSPLQMEDFDDSFTSCGGFGDIFGPNLDIPECQKDSQCVVVGYNTDAVPFPQCDRTFTNQLKAGDVLKRQQGTTLSLQPLHF